MGRGNPLIVMVLTPLRSALCGILLLSVVCGCGDGRAPVTSKYTLLYFHDGQNDPRGMQRKLRAITNNIDTCSNCLKALGGVPAIQVIELDRIPHWQQKLPSLAEVGDSIGLEDPNGALLGTANALALSAGPEECINMLLQRRSAIEIQKHAIEIQMQAPHRSDSELFRCGLNLWLAMACQKAGDQPGTQAALDAMLVEFGKMAHEDQCNQASYVSGWLQQIQNLQSPHPLLAEHARQYLTSALEGDATAVQSLHTILLFDDQLLGDLNPLLDRIAEAPADKREIVLNALRPFWISLLVRAGRCAEAIQAVQSTYPGANYVAWARQLLVVNTKQINLPFSSIHLTPEETCNEVVSLAEALYATGNLVQGDAVCNEITQHIGNNLTTRHLKQLQAARARCPGASNSPVPANWPR